MKSSIRLFAVAASAALVLFAAGASNAIAQDAGAAASGEPTVAQIYQAANSGQLDRADAMVDRVLKSHPNSGKAHYIKAELAAREGKTDVAKQELATAEKFAPGLPFAKTESVQALRNQLSNTNANAAATTSARQMNVQGDAAAYSANNAARAEPQRGFPWGVLAIVAAIVIIGVIVLGRRTAAIANQGYAGTPGAQPGYSPDYPPGYPPNAPPGYNPYPQQQPSMGSTIARGVGTGLAIGAGMVVAEEVGRHMFGQGDARAAGFSPGAAGNVNTPSLDQIDDGMRRNLNSDMGGNDFGVNDGGGWDSGGGGGGGGGGDWDT